jgi:hypothetical protein
LTAGRQISIRLEPYPDPRLCGFSTCGFLHRLPAPRLRARAKPLATLRPSC